MTVHSLSLNYLIETRLEWSLEKISACFSWLDNLFSEI